MGHTLQSLAKSVNIKERKDFSCALFTKKGELIANAPHIPVHLGSMGDVVLNIIKDHPFSEGDMFLSNSPQSGGTHLPDLTVVAPLYFKGELAMWVASRGHHADIGGISPGSMPGNSTSLIEEGIVINPLKIVEEGKLLESSLKKVLTENDFPVRNYSMNLHDIKAKVAANFSGIFQLLELHQIHGCDTLSEMAERVLDYSHKKIMGILAPLPLGKATKVISEKRQITVELKKEKSKFLFDFTGTSLRQPNNFNTPNSVVKAAVLFCLRCLIDDDIPLNSGIMRSIELKIPQDSFLNPDEDSAVVSGNVETSQALCDVLFECLGFMANSQGTMNNLSFGNETYQYYETLAGGSGASQKGNGTSGVQVHMTNSLLTDPEVFESRFPVLIELMALRHGSGGHGKLRGGDGISRKLLFREDMTVNMISQSRVVPPKGLDHGFPGQVGKNQKDSKGKLQSLSENFSDEFKAGDRLIVDTPGGGGFQKPIEEERALVFSFGSNMDVQQIQTRCPSAQVVTRAYLKDRELRYSLYSDIRKGGVADTMVSPGKSVTGLLVSLSKDCLEILDSIECGQSHYKRIPLTVFDDNNKSYEVFAYDVIDKEPDIPPHIIYEWLVFSGAYRLNTPQSYLENISKENLKVFLHSEE
ncbi:MAG: hydantoinase B/oxoprolinase family protein, partial [Halobacteriovoraceae bacterium]|nr:hydantoinase B/oxoprolinase family protein [Halobacteriovoraceae bacterium]